MTFRQLMENRWLVNTFVFNLCLECLCDALTRLDEFVHTAIEGCTEVEITCSDAGMNRITPTHEVNMDVTRCVTTLLILHFQVA